METWKKSAGKNPGQPVSASTTGQVSHDEFTFLTARLFQKAIFSTSQEKKAQVPQVTWKC